MQEDQLKSSFSHQISSQRLQQLGQQAETVGARLMWQLSGDSLWCREQAMHWLAYYREGRCLWCGSNAPLGAEAVSSSHLSSLGQNVQLVIVDAHESFDPNLLCAASGAIAAGGSLLLLTPPAAIWSKHSDGFAQRYGIDTANSYFIARCQRQLDECEMLGQFHQHGALRWPLLASHAATQSSAEKSTWQSSVNRLALDNQRDIVQLCVGGVLADVSHQVVLADRGRGKSTALAQIAAQLTVEHRQAVVITAPLKANAQRVLDVYAQKSESALRYAAFDALLDDSRPGSARVNPAETVLLIDEAAAIPLPVLKALIQRFTRVVLATTVQGYEGSGYGFLHRFLPFLAGQVSTARLYHLTEPMRWSAHDGLEPIMNTLSCSQPLQAVTLSCLASHLALPVTRLDSQQHSVLQSNDAPVRAESDMGAEVECSPVSARWLSKASLLADENRLREVFSLLAEAHYQTRPSDYRQFLDDPRLRVAVLCEGARVLAVVVVSVEGKLPKDIAGAIVSGSRRPQGHLLAQAMMQSVRDIDMAGLSIWRVARIAVPQALRRHGYASRLMQFLFNEAQAEGVDILGSSFALQSDSAAFWLRQGLRPVGIGLKADRASGAHSLMMAQALSAPAADYIPRLEQLFSANWPHWKEDELRALDAACRRQLDDMLLVSAPSLQGELNASDMLRQDQAFIHAFIDGELDYERASPMIKRVCGANHLSPKAICELAPVLYARLYEGESWLSLSRRWPQYSGRRALIQAIRGELERLRGSGFGAF